MTRRLERPSAEALARVRALAGRTLSRDEFEAARRLPISDAEMAEMQSLIDWFCRRYPTAADRLRYVRRAYARWTRHQR